MIEEKYNFKVIEEKWQKYWEENKTFKTELDKTKEKYYAMVEFPYPSGEGLHVGHPRSYTALDIIARKKRMDGLNVLYPMGFDAFGLPAENYAVKTGIHPSVVTKDNMANYVRQLKSLGFSFDWDRMIDTSSPEYYKWTQWIFLKLFENDLAYKHEMMVNWCPSCKTGLSNEEVINSDKCERCGAVVERKKKSQWMLRITAYADKLIEGLNEVDYLDSIKAQQVNWIGKSVGAEVDFSITAGDDQIKVFTTRVDTMFGATYMVLAPEHELVAKYMDSFENTDDVKTYVEKTGHKSDLERTIEAGENKEKTGVELKGFKAINPFNNKEIPVFISDYVLASYGTGAIMAVPAHDQRDWDFAKAFDLPIIPVLEGGDIEKEAWNQEGKHINSEFLDGLGKEDAIAKAIEFATEHKVGEAKVNYKLRDWVFSRQRYWGEPIPLINCPTCGWVKVPESELPLELPMVDDFMPADDGQSPLAKATDWVNCKCPKCQGDATRETDTMPNWAGSSWYFLRYCDPKNSKEFASKEALDYFMPVDWYNGGMEHTTLHLLYSRFWNQFLFDIGVVPTLEPYKKRTSHGMILGEDGSKMSKSRGNVVNPDHIVAEYGADTFRVYEMFIGPFDQSAAWNESSLVGVFRFLKRIWVMQDKLADVELSDKDENIMHNTIKNIGERIDKNHQNTAVSFLMEMSNYMGDLETIPTKMYSIFIQLLSPFAVHLAEEIWSNLGNSETISKSEWPEYDESKMQVSTVTIGVQVMGKLRSEVELSPDATEDEAKELVLADPKVQNFIDGKEIKKFIYVKGKIINIVAV